MTDLPGITSTTRTLDADRARARSLANARDLAGLDAGSRAHFEARDDRAGVNGDDFDIDSEILQFQFDQAGHRLERLG